MSVCTHLCDRSYFHPTELPKRVQEEEGPEDVRGWPLGVLGGYLMAHWGSLEVLGSTLGDPGTSLRGPCDAPGLPTGSLLPPRGVPGARLGTSSSLARPLCVPTYYPQGTPWACQGLPPGPDRPWRRSLDYQNQRFLHISNGALEKSPGAHGASPMSPRTPPGLSGQVRQMGFCFLVWKHR